MRIDDEFLSIERIFGKSYHLSFEEVYRIESIHEYRQPVKFRVHFRDQKRKKITFTDLGLSSDDSFTLERRCEKVMFHSGYIQEYQEQQNQFYELQKKKVDDDIAICDAIQKKRLE